MTCEDLGIRLCIHCREQSGSTCWSEDYCNDDRIIGQPDQTIIKHFFQRDES
jgi:hypothetical protein